jgi:hypothetical protein
MCSPPTRKDCARPGTLTPSTTCSTATSAASCTRLPIPARTCRNRSANACFFPGISIPLVYRFRPLDVDHCIHEILLLRPVPADGSRPSPAEVVHLGIDDSYATVPAFVATGLAHVLDQDTANFRRQRRGMRASQKPGQTLGNYQEVRIRHFHQVLDEYLAG